jgi:hypothetical protein
MRNEFPEASHRKYYEGVREVKTTISFSPLFDGIAGTETVLTAPDRSNLAPLPRNKNLVLF